MCRDFSASASGESHATILGFVMEMYFVVKKAVYDHGVMWIGSDIDEGKRKADHLASNHDDGHHEYELRLFREPKIGNDYHGYGWQDECDVVYVGTKAI